MAQEVERFEVKPPQEEKPDDMLKLIADCKRIGAELRAWKREKKSGTSRPYYNEKYATEMRRYCDKLIEDKSHDLFLGLPEKMPLNTRRAQIFNGLAYLAEKMDTPEKKYSKFRSLLKVESRLNGFIMRVRDKAPDAVPVNRNENKEFANKWRMELEEFAMSDQTNITFREEGLVLEPDDIQFVHDLLGGNPGIVYKVTPNLITAVKLDPT